MRDDYRTEPLESVCFTPEYRPDGTRISGRVTVELRGAVDREARKVAGR